MIAAAVTVAGVMLVAWFPLSPLLEQRGALSSASAQLADLSAQDRVLAKEKANLSSPAEISRLARQQYQLVEPGRKLVQVLPPSGEPSSLGGAPTPGDPGLAPVVDPSAVALIPAGSSANPEPVSTPRAATKSSPGLLSRIVNTLEFWKG
jgi:hypothetical protein